MDRKNIKEYKYAVLDIETDPFRPGRKPEPFCCAVYDGEEHKLWWGDNCIRDMCAHIGTMSGYTIYAHNGGKFDFHFLCDYLDTDMMLINGRISKAAINNVQLRDSYNLLPRPLSSYKKDDIDYDVMERENREKNKTKILQYLGTDCFYLHEWLGKFFALFGTNLTLSGTAFKELKKSGYVPDKCSVEYDKKFREYYFGGRVSVFETGEIKHETPLEYRDINSAYPAAMMCAHPYGTDVVTLHKLPETAGGWFASITAVSRGALPYRARDEDPEDTGTLTFPDDDIERKYLATGWEIVTGIETGTLDVISVETVIQHVDTSSMSDFVAKFFALRAEAKSLGNDADAAMYKRILVSAYGKFGQTGERYKKYALIQPDCVHPDYVPQPERNENDSYWGVCGIWESGHAIWEIADPSDHRNNVATAASITGFVRSTLWRAICASEGAIYTDTDSLICRRFGGNEGPELGQWGLEGRINECYIAGKKLYALLMTDGTKRTASKGAKIAYNDLVDMAVNKTPIKYIQEAPSYSLRFGVRFIDREIGRSKKRLNN